MSNRQLFTLIDNDIRHRVDSRRAAFLKQFLSSSFVDILGKNCVSYSELSFPFRYDGKYSSNVKSSLQWSAWLSWISQRSEWTVGILKFFCFHQARKSKQTRKKIVAHTHNANGDVGHLDHTSRFWFHRSPWFFSLLLSFFSLNFVFLALMDYLLFHWSFFFYFLFLFFIFSVWAFKAFWIVLSCDVQMFYLCFSW